MTDECKDCMDIYKDITNCYSYLLDEYKTICGNKDKEIEALKNASYIAEILNQVVNVLIDKYGEEAKKIAEDIIEKSGIKVQE